MVLFALVAVAVIWHIEKIKLIPQYGKVFYEMGMHCEDECEKNKQLGYFQKAVHHDPDIGTVHYRLGLIYEQKGDYTKALECFLKATELDQSDMLSFYKVGRQYFRAGAYEQALRYFMKVYKGSGYPDDVRYYLALIYDHEKKYDLAVEFYNRIVLLNDEYAERVFPRLAQIYYFFMPEGSAEAQIDRLREWKQDDLGDQLQRAFEAAQASGALNAAEGAD